MEAYIMGLNKIDEILSSVVNDVKIIEQSKRDKKHFSRMRKMSMMMAVFFCLT
jgi:hypothetical protein